MAVVCPSCGTENPESAKFCLNCATSLADIARPAETRRTVTILFADVSGSTSLGEQLDPESLRALMSRYFAEMQAIIERHGGTVEKFIGDAVMAVFGIPILHEDDALRAVRAAADIRERLATLNAELEGERGIAIRFRTGVNTGEVVAGDPASDQQLVVGDAVNTAARLEQAAPIGEILIGPLTYQLVRDAVAAEALEPLALKGKAEALAAYRLTSVTRGAPGHARRLDTPLVGRSAELARLQEALNEAVTKRRCGLVTLLGAAGVGKSRLLAEFLASVSPHATVLAGRCLPYGEGISYWPIAEVIRAAASIDEADDREAAQAKLHRLAADAPESEVVAERIGQAIGLAGGSAPQEELFWALRKLLETLARQRPLAIEFDDLQWADDTFLDLLEHIVSLAHDAPLLLLCPARPELLERRPAWGSGWAGAIALRLEPLAPETSGQLIDQLPGGRELPDLLRTRILDVAEGNPLFVEEMVAMLLEDGGVAGVDPDAVAVPPTISALLAARLDGLQPGERSLAERASVVGQSFEQAALVELLPTDAGGGLTRDLLGLVRKDLIRPDRSLLSAGDAYRFRHLLIRDAAYAALPKADRAELHQRFGDWLERVSGDRLEEFEEIIGYHFERALGYRRELGSSATPQILVNLGLSAAEHLGKAAYRSLDRSDLPAAARLLNRALNLIPRDDARRAEWTADLVDAHIQLGDMQPAAALVDDLENLSQTDQTARAWYLVSRLESSLYLGTYSAVESEGLAEEALRSFAALDHHRGLARTFLARAHADWYQLHGGASVRWLTRAADHARRAARRSDELGVLVWLIRALAWGPTPVTHALRELDSLDSDLGGDRRIEASVARTRAMLIAMHGGHAQARALHERSITLFGELGMALDLGEAAQSGYYVAKWGGDPKTARRWLEESCDLLARRGERTLFSTNAAMLARALLDQGNRDAAAEWLQRAFEAASADDRVTQAQARSLTARVSAESGDEPEADRLVAEALMLIGDSAGTDFWIDAEVMSDAAYVHQAVGRSEEAVALLEQARERHVSKESLVEAESLENRIAQLRAGQPEGSPGS